MPRRLSVCILIVFCAVMTGCGFHLRKDAIRICEKYPVMILPFTGSHTFHQALRRSLRSHSVDLLKRPSESTVGCYPTLCIVSEDRLTQPIVYADGELRRERLFMTVTFSFGYTEFEQIEFSTVRDHQLYSSQYLGDNAEKSLLETEMQADIIQQLLRYIESEQFQ
jgi:outer membrane lipopolysaccharide assembly protein LptE/RlpB